MDVKIKVYENKSNDYDYDACKEMLNHKSALKNMVLKVVITIG